MKLTNRRRFLRLAAGAAALPGMAGKARALDYPTRPVHLVGGFAPGGIIDILGRLIGQWLSQRLGQPFIVESRTGAGGNIAAAFVARAKPDGYTLLLLSSVNSWNTAIYDNLDFDFLHDITPIATIEHAGGVMAVNPAFPAKTVGEFIACAKANPGKLNMGTGGPGSAQHLWGELFKVMAGVDLFTVHYRGSGQALPDLLSGRLDVMFDPIASSIGYLKAGKLRPLGVTTPARFEVLPDVPMIGDSVPGYVATGWIGLGAPANTPTDIVALLNKEVNAALVDPPFKGRLSELGMQPLANSPSETVKFIAEYTEKWGKVIRQAGITAQ